MPKGIYQHQPLTEITKEKLRRIAIKNNFGKNNKGKKLSKEIKEKMRQRMLGNKRGFKKGNKANWKGGITKNRKAYYKEWQGKNRERVNFYTGMYRFKKKKAEGFFTLSEWELLKKQYGYTCANPICGKKEPEIRLEPDHIIPISKGGSNYIENIQPLCRGCNSKKHTKIIKYF